jgi:hypothetical protein
VTRSQTNNSHGKPITGQSRGREFNDVYYNGVKVRRSTRNKSKKSFLWGLVVNILNFYNFDIKTYQWLGLMVSPKSFRISCWDLINLWFLFLDVVYFVFFSILLYFFLKEKPLRDYIAFLFLYALDLSPLWLLNPELDVFSLFTYESIFLLWFPFYFPSA